MNIDTNKPSDISDRLRCRYPMGPIMPNGEPEFGWRDFSGAAPEGMVLPTALMLEAANHIDAQAAEIEALRQPWQPIETAPRALGTLILGRLRSGRICTITPHYSVIVGPEKAGGGRETIGQKFNGYSEDCGDSLIPRTVSHWMPLPAPPAALSGESNASD